MIHRKYDGQKRIISECYSDHNGTPMINSRGIYQITYDYNENGKVVRECYFDENGYPKVAKNGFVAIERDWDDEGNLINERGILSEETIEETLETEKEGMVLDTEEQSPLVSPAA